LKLKIGIDGKQYEVDVEILEDDTASGSYLPPHGPPTTVQSVAVSAPGMSSVPPVQNNVDEAKVARSPVAGIVNKVNVQAGQLLQANDLMMVLEAMKMETNITAPAAGKVRQVNVAHGDGVKVNQVLVEFE
jgi:methylmalonyl-CoA carboxyltransferase small subunit